MIKKSVGVHRSECNSHEVISQGEQQYLLFELSIVLIFATCTSDKYYKIFIINNSIF